MIDLFLTRPPARFIRRPITSRGQRPKLDFDRLEERELLNGDVILTWNEVALDAVAADHSGGTPSQGGPTRTARALAIVHAAMFDAANCTDKAFTPYVIKLSQCKTGSMDAAVSQAARDTLSALYPRQQAAFDAALEQSLAEVEDGKMEKKGISLGRHVARQILSVRKHDGSQRDTKYETAGLPGEHVADPLHADQGYLDPGWGSVTPFALSHGAQFRAPAPPTMTSDAYAAAFDEVRELGGDGVVTPTSRTAEQTEIGIFWGYDGSPGLGTPPRLYNQIARNLADQQGNTVMENARLFALVNLAMADAGIAAWETKYMYNFWRPIVAIRDAARDGNPDTVADLTWTPLGAPCSNDCPATTNFTPSFPAYTSGHATFGAAMFETLANFYGRDNIPFCFTSDEFNGVTTDQSGAVRAVVTRSWNRFSEAMWENAESRIYLGIHWRFDAVYGVEQGVSVADYVFQNYLKPLK